MHKQNHNSWHGKIERKQEQKDKKRRKNMKVSGASVKVLQKIITGK